MEDFVFPRPAVAGELQHFIEARLHSDSTDTTHRARIAELIDSIAGGIGQPIYVALDPVTSEELGRYEGAAFDSRDIKAFVQFLKDARAKQAAL